MSTSENKDIQQRFLGEFNVQYAAGAGYKLICVAQDLADAYLLSKDTVFKWDSCGPHAILRSLGGGLLTFQGLLDLAKQGENFRPDDLSRHEVLYNMSVEGGSSGISKFCNKGGLIAYHKFSVLKAIFGELKKL